MVYSFPELRDLKGREEIRLNEFQLLEAFNDDGEKFGGERVLRVMQENQAVDVITICCRWVGPEHLGHIALAV